MVELEGEKEALCWNKNEGLDGGAKSTVALELLHKLRTRMPSMPPQFRPAFITINSLLRTEWLSLSFSRCLWLNPVFLLLFQFQEDKTSAFQLNLFSLYSQLSNFTLITRCAIFFINIVINFIWIFSVQKKI